MRSPWSLVPLGALVLLMVGYGVNRIRTVGGEGDGFLLAGAGLVIAGIFTCLSVLGKEDKKADAENRAAWEKLLDRRDARRRELDDLDDKEAD